MVREMAAKKSQRQLFKAPKELLKPIPWPGPKPPFVVQGLIESDEKFAARRANHDAECERAYSETAREANHRLFILARSLGIEPDPKDGRWLWFFCAELARRLCPVGFSVEYREKIAGRQKKWTERTYMELIADVEAVKMEKGCDDTTACRSLVRRAINSKRGRYLPSKNSSLEQTAATLMNRLSEARNPQFNIWARLLRNSEYGPEYEDYMREAVIKAYGVPEIVRE